MDNFWKNYIKHFTRKKTYINYFLAKREERAGESSTRLFSQLCGGASPAYGLKPRAV